MTRTNYRVAVIGHGAVGQAMTTLFPGAVIYDPALGFADREAVNACRFAFICVPTPARPDGSCDTSTVDETMAWLTCEIAILRSTVPPGTTDALAARFARQVVFQPEYGPGETPDHPFRDVRAISWVILGGQPAATRAVCELYQQVLNSSLALHQTDAVTAELTKYMENAFLAVKVAFCNEFYDIAGRLGVDYHTLRELWLQDPRIGRSHTWVQPDDRGFGGKCLPKDMSALVHTAHALGYQPLLLEGAIASNEAVRNPET